MFVMNGRAHCARVHIHKKMYRLPKQLTEPAVVGNSKVWHGWGVVEPMQLHESKSREGKRKCRRKCSTQRAHSAEGSQREKCSSERIKYSQHQLQGFSWGGCLVYYISLPFYSTWKQKTRFVFVCVRWIMDLKRYSCIHRHTSSSKMSLLVSFSSLSFLIFSFTQAYDRCSCKIGCAVAVMSVRN